MRPSESAPLEESDPAARPSRDRILDLAREVLEREGVDALTIRALAKVAGVHHASIYYAFGTKEDLLSELLTRALRPVREAIARSLEELPPESAGMAGALGVMAEGLAGLHQSHRDGLRVLFRGEQNQPRDAFEKVASILTGNAADRLEYTLATTSPDVSRRLVRGVAQLTVMTLVLWALGRLDGDEPARLGQVVRLLSAGASALGIES